VFLNVAELTVQEACNGPTIFPAYFVDVAGRCALESAPACDSLAYSALFKGPSQGDPVSGEAA